MWIPIGMHENFDVEQGLNVIAYFLKVVCQAVLVAQKQMGQTQGIAVCTEFYFVIYHDLYHNCITS